MATDARPPGRGIVANLRRPGYSDRVIPRPGRLLVAALLAGALSACSAPTPTVSPSASVDPVVACEAVADTVVAAVARTVAAYDGAFLTPASSASPSATPPTFTTPPTPATQPDPSPPPGPSTAPTPGAAPADLAGVVSAARQEVQRLGCPASVLDARLSRGLAAVEASGPVAAAVLARLTATLVAQPEATPGPLRPGDDLAKAVAAAPAGATVDLAEGTFEVAVPLVALDAVTLRGAGRGRTVVRSTAADAAVLDLAAARVELRDLDLHLSGTAGTSGVVAGSDAALVLTRVGIRGARTGEAGGAGGAGVLLSATGDAPPGRRTTLEVTDSEFADNAWAGIGVTGGHVVSVVSSTFTANGACGVCFLDASGGSVATSTLDGNQVGVGVTGTARPTLIDVAITGGTVGVQVEGTSAATLERVRVTGAERAAIIVAGSATGAIGHSVCRSVPYGIVVAEGAAPTLTANDCAVAQSR